MKKIFLFALLLAAVGASAQTKGYLRYDTLVLQKVGGNSELVILNGTRNVAGLLTNMGNGRTEFVASRVSGDTLFIGRDTLTGIGSGSGGGLSRGNLGSGYRLYVPDSAGVKTVVAGSGLTADSAVTDQVRFKWGQAIGASGNPAAFTEAREIPMGQDSLYISSKGNETRRASMRFWMPSFGNDAYASIEQRGWSATGGETKLTLSSGGLGGGMDIFSNPVGSDRVFPGINWARYVGSTGATTQWVNMGVDRGPTTSHFYIDLKNEIGAIAFEKLGVSFANFRDDGLTFLSASGTNPKVRIGASSGNPTRTLDVRGTSIFHDTIRLKQPPLLTSASGYDVLVRNRTDSSIRALPYDSISAGSGGATPGIAATIAADNVLTEASTIIDADGKELVIQDASAFIVEAQGNKKRLVIKDDESYMYSPDLDSRLRLTDDSTFLTIPHFSNDTSTLKAVKYDPTTGQLAYGNYATGSGGGSGWALNGNAATAGASTGDFLGTTNNVSLRLRTNNIERILLDSNGRINHLAASNQGFRIKQGAEAGTASGSYFNGIIFERPSNTESYRIGFGPASLFTIGYNNGGVYTTQLYLNNVGKMGIAGTSPTAYLHLPASTGAATFAPLKFTSGTLMATAEAGAVEFLTDKWYATITTGAARKEITLNDAPLTSGTVPVATTNGRLTDGLVISSGTYTPTSSAASGITVSAIEPFTYSRVGNSVTVSGYISTSGATAGTPASFELTLPVTSDLSTEYQATGNVSSIVAGSDGWVKGSAANNSAVIQWVGGSTAGTQGLRISFQYQVL